MSSSPASSPDRRADARYAAHFDVRFSRVSDAARALNAFSVNFSAGGLCVRSGRSDHQLGDALSLELTIEGQQFSLEGVVAWQRGDAVGVRFVNVDQVTRKRLEAVARTLSRKLAPVQ